MRIDGRINKPLSVGQAAKYLGIHRNTLRRWAAEGKVSHYTIGKGQHRRFRPADLDKCAERPA